MQQAAPAEAKPPKYHLLTRLLASPPAILKEAAVSKIIHKSVSSMNNAITQLFWSRTLLILCLDHQIFR